MMGRVFSSIIPVFMVMICTTAFGADKPIDSPEKATKPSNTYLLWHFSPSDGATPELTSRIENSIRSYFSQFHSNLLMSGMNMDSLLLVEGNEKYLRCGSGAGCLSGLGKLAGVKYVIAGEVSFVAHKTTTTLYLVEVKRKRVKLRASVQSSGTPSRKKMEELSIAMFEPDKYKGSVLIISPVPKAEIYIDGKLMGTTTMEKSLDGIVAGEHLLELKKPGRQPFAKTIQVPMGSQVKVIAILPEVPFLKIQPRPFYSDWPFWTTAGIGVIALGVAGILYHSADVYQANADKLTSSHSADADVERDKADSRYLQSYVMFGIGGAGILTSGIIALIDVLSSSDSTGKNQSLEPSFHLVSSPSGIGIGTLITF